MHLAHVKAFRAEGPGAQIVCGGDDRRIVGVNAR